MIDSTQAPQKKNALVPVLIGVIILLVIAVVAVVVLNDSGPDKPRAAARDAAPTTSAAAPTTRVPVAPPVTPIVPAPRSFGNDSLFLDTMHAKSLNRYGSDVALVNLAHSACSALDTGLSIQKIRELTRNAGWSVYDTDYMLAGAVTVYCMQHSDVLAALDGS